MIERYLLRYFLAVVDLGSFSAAARACAVSQPTLSVGVAKLERLLGGLLFQRSARRVELTAAGARFLAHARRIEAEFARAEAAVADGEARRELRLGVISTLPAAWIEAAAAAAIAVAGERIELVEGRMRDLVPRLDRGRLDAVLGVLGGAPGEGETLIEEPYALAMSAAHPLAARSEIAPAELAGEPMIVRRHSEELAEVSRFFTGHGVRPFMAARVECDARAVALVRAGLGLTVLPRGFAASGLVLPAMTGFALTRRIGLRVDAASTRRVADSAAITAFAAAIAAANRHTSDLSN